MDKLSYALCLGIGRQLSQMGAENLNIDDFAQAIKDILEGKELQVADQEAQTIVTEFFQQQEAKQRAAAAEKYKENKDKGARSCDIPFFYCSFYIQNSKTIRSNSSRMSDCCKSSGKCFLCSSDDRDRFCFF